MIYSCDIGIHLLFHIWFFKCFDSGGSRTFPKGGPADWPKLQSCFNDSVYNQPNFSHERGGPGPQAPPWIRLCLIWVEKMFLISLLSLRILDTCRIPEVTAVIFKWNIIFYSNDYFKIIPKFFYVLYLQCNPIYNMLFEG